MLIQELKVRKIINAHGHLTTLGGTIVSEEVIQAMKEVSKVYLDMLELHRNAGEFIAALLDAEYAYVVSGAAAGLVLSSEACMLDNDGDSISAPQSRRMQRNKIVVQRMHRNPFTFVSRIAGAEVFEVGSEKETNVRDFQTALNDEGVAAVMHFAFDPQEGELPLEQVLEISHSKKIPVIVDAASELPPVENLKRFTKMGADLVVFSGGKEIGAPSDTGIILGKRNLIERCHSLGYYAIDTDSEMRATLGRSMKVSKEDVFALVAALKNYLNADHAAIMREWNRKDDYIINQLLKNNKFLKARKMHPIYYLADPRPHSIPIVEIDFDGIPEGILAEQVANQLKRGTVPVYVHVNDNKLFVNPQCLQEDEEKIVASRLSEVIHDLVRSP